MTEQIENAVNEIREGPEAEAIEYIKTLATRASVHGNISQRQVSDAIDMLIKVVEGRVHTELVTLIVQHHSFAMEERALDIGG